MGQKLSFLKGENLGWQDEMGEGGGRRGRGFGLVVMEKGWGMGLGHWTGSGWRSSVEGS
jgi:hypothetical protein